MTNQGEVWRLPDSVNPNPDYRCVILRIPNEPEYIKAFYDSYDSLCRWISWEQRGDKSAADASGLFRKHAPIWADCEIADSIDRDGNMAITINLTSNCNCGGGAVNVTVPVQINPQGQPVATNCLPVSPNDPLNTSPISGDIYENSPPAGWDDWQQFISARCIIANYSVDNILRMVTSADNAENSSSIIMDVLGVLLLLLPTPIGKLSAPTKLLKLLEKLRVVKTAVEAAIEDGEQVNDYLQTLGLFIENNKQQAVCFFHSAYSPSDYSMKMTERANEWFSTQPNLPEWYKSLILDFYGEAFWQMFDTMTTKAAFDLIESGYIPSLNCDTCSPIAVPFQYAGSLGFTWPETWSGGHLLKWNGSAVVDASGVAITNQHILEHTQFIQDETTAGRAVTLLSAKTAATSNHTKGQLQQSHRVNRFLINPVVQQTSFGWINAKIWVADELILDQNRSRDEWGMIVYELPEEYPAGTIFKVSLSRSASWVTMLGRALFALQ